MNPKDKLAEIEENWPRRKQIPTRMTLNIEAGDLDWLINRVKRLTEALELIEAAARKALEEK